MVNWDKAIIFVRQRGNWLDQLRLRRALGEHYTLVEAEEVLTPYQFPDGSWDYNAPEEKSERIGSLGGTIHCLRWLREFGLGGNPQMARTLEFLTRVMKRYVYLKLNRSYFCSVLVLGQNIAPGRLN